MSLLSYSNLMSLFLMPAALVACAVTPDQSSHSSFQESSEVYSKLNPRIENNIGSEYASEKSYYMIPIAFVSQYYEDNSIECEEIFISGQSHYCGSEILRSDYGSQFILIEIE